jgi:hypothetical protein
VSEVTYRAFLEDAGAGRAAGAFAELDDDAIATRRKDADRRLTVRVSKRQARWLERVDGVTGDGVDAGDVVRALLDLGRELDVDWALIARGGQLREAVRGSVRVRRPEAS